MMRVYALLLTARMSLCALKSNRSRTERSILYKYLPCHSWSMLLLNLNTQFLSFESHNLGTFAD